MKVLVDIPDKQADFGMEVLRSLSFIKKAQPISRTKVPLIKEIKQAVIELGVVKAGKLKARPVEDLLNEL